MPKSTENTVFVRFVPVPTHKLRRHQLENIFSEIGPIKKTSWIHSKENTSKGYGFVKYLSCDDARAASSSLNDTKIQFDGVDYKVFVEVASVGDEKGTEEKQQHPASSKVGQDNSNNIPNEILKKKSRIILRNLSFYAKENHIRSVLEKKYGDIVDVHLPRVQSNLHVGFGFVTFSNPESAQRAIDDKKIDILNRTVSMDFSLPKSVHQQVKRSENIKKDEDESRGSVCSTDHVEDDLDIEVEREVTAEKDVSMVLEHSDSALKDARTIFLRNLPFDTTRDELLHLFGKFGHIESIYLVKDKATAMLKGTAFITYKRGPSAQAAISTASNPLSVDDGSLISPQRPRKTAPNPTGMSDSSIVLKGRKILVAYAVDKETADTFDSKERSSTAADRRNMYLQSEGRVESTPLEPGSDTSNTWDEIPEPDKKKRQSALKDKTTKLQSPMFFINPNRLSIRNLSKHIEEPELRTLCESATKKGLLSGLVSAKDHIAHLRAQGQLTTREILSTIEEKGKTNEDIITPWNEDKKTKEYIPSVYIDRDYGSRSATTKAPSRGFGFAEFTHHIHALACLRELNNNPAYSVEYVAGGKSALEMKRKGSKLGSKGGKRVDIRVPRLIVDFTVRLLCP